MSKARRAALLSSIIASCVVVAVIVSCRLTGDRHESPRAFASDPILTLGHGAFVGQDGKEFVPDVDFIVSLQAHYIGVLTARLDSKKSGASAADAKRMESIAYKLVDDAVLAGAVQIDWLLERVEGADVAHMTMVNHALRWFYINRIQENPVLPRPDGTWFKGLREDVAARLKDAGFVVAIATSEGGAAYRASCEKAGVPLPSRVMSSDWTNRGTFDREFLSETSEAELWLWESSDPPGVCLALPRYIMNNGNATNDIDLLGVICLGTQSNKACFFDNPRRRTFRRGEQPRLSEFVGGADLVANGQGICTECHAGENPYVVHPEKTAFAGLTDRLRPQGWHDPLVVASWPHNPGPTNILDAVSSPRSCASCHTRSFAGRFPEVSQELGGYCAVVLGQAVGALPKRTMPMGGGNITNFQPHIDALRQACQGAEPSEGVVVDSSGFNDDASYISPPRLYEPIYACATNVAVRGAVLDAKVVVFVNGTEAKTFSPARDPDRTEITGLPELRIGDIVTARQVSGGVTSDPSPPVTVRDHRLDYPGGLPAPSIDPTTVYECSGVIAVRHVPGAKVTVLVNGGSPVTFTGSGGGWTAIAPGKRPFAIGDAFTASIALCADTSPMSAPVWAADAPASIPAARFNPASIVSGQELVNIENLTNGSESTVTEATLGTVGTFSTPISWKPNYDVATRIGRPLSSSDRLSVGQQLCDVRADGIATVPLECRDLPAPRIRHPLVGETFVIVTEAVPGARIRIYDGSNTEIGDGSGVVIVLRRAITGADTLTVTQQVGNCVGTKAYRVSVRNPGSKKKG